MIETLSLRTKFKVVLNNLVIEIKNIIIYIYIFKQLAKLWPMEFSPAFCKSGFIGLLTSENER